MVNYDMFEVLSQNRFDNNDSMISYSPYQTPIWVRRFKPHVFSVPADAEKKIEGDPFGYEIAPASKRPIPAVTAAQQEDQFDFHSEAIIIYTPKRAFLKSIGILWDSSRGDSLPIVAVFKDADAIEREDVILVDVHDTGAGHRNNLMPRKLKVTEILSVGNLYQFAKFYRLAPLRDGL